LTSPTGRTAPAATKDLKRGARHEPLGEELHIAITSLENIIRSKTASGRADDLAALPQL
jgi:hypothetical protein